MVNLQLIKRGFVHAAGVGVYVFLIAWVFRSLSGRNLPENILAPMIMLMLLVLSVAVVGMLIFARPVTMYLDGQKKEAVWTIVYTLIWLAIFVVATLLVFTHMRA